jgi:hypothetical protein
MCEGGRPPWAWGLRTGTVDLGGDRIACAGVECHGSVRGDCHLRCGGDGDIVQILLAVAVDLGADAIAAFGYPGDEFPAGDTGTECLAGVDVEHADRAGRQVLAGPVCNADFRVVQLILDEDADSGADDGLAVAAARGEQAAVGIGAAEAGSITRPTSDLPWAGTVTVLL